MITRMELPPSTRRNPSIAEGPPHAGGSSLCSASVQDTDAGRSGSRTRNAPEVPDVQ